MIYRELFQSKSSPGSPPYEAIYDSDTGNSSCSCRGWRIKRINKPRECDHTRRMVAKYGGGTPVPVAPEPVKPMTFIEPMLASGAADLGEDKVNLADYRDETVWIMEPKIDGHRMIVHYDGQVLAYIRGGKIRQLPLHIAQTITEKLPKGVYDGELFYPGGKASDVVRVDVAGRLRLVLFDLLTESCIQQPYWMRREALIEAGEALEANDPVGVIMAWPVDAHKINEIWERGGEGVVIKRLSSMYRPGARSRDWVKIKKEGTTVATIIGFMDGKNGPYSRVRVRENGREFDVKTLDNDHLRRFAAHSDAYVGRKLVISYNERLASGALRHPMFDHVVMEG